MKGTIGRNKKPIQYFTVFGWAPIMKNKQNKRLNILNVIKKVTGIDQKY
jgi:hypothetical protein